MLVSVHDEQLLNNGYTVIEDVYDGKELKMIIEDIETVDTSNPTFRKTSDLFAIRQFLKEVPGVQSHLFNIRLKAIITRLFGDEYFVVKSIYFDKPVRSNWFVAWHQDLTISVSEKTEFPGFINWTKKHNQFAVQPPIALLQDNFTIRIHLDNTNEHNGALKVIPGSHLKGINTPDNIDQEVSCNVKAGGVMLMKPLLMHASGRSTNNKRRRVIHIEFSRAGLPGNLKWSETII